MVSPGGVWAQGDDLESTGQTNRRREGEAGRPRDEIVFSCGREGGSEVGRPEQDTMVTGDKGLQERAAGVRKVEEKRRFVRESADQVRDEAEMQAG